MSTPINRLPLGLLGFLGIKNGGRYPSTITDVLQAQWDLSSIYLGTNCEWSESIISAAPGGGFVNAFEVPAGEVWYVLNVSAYSATLAAGEAIAFNVALRDPGGSVIVPLGERTAIAAPAERASTGYPQELVLSSGTDLGVWVTNITTAATIGLSVDIRFARMLA